MPIQLPLILAGFLAVASPDSGMSDSMPGLSAPGDQADQDMIAPRGHGPGDRSLGEQSGPGEQKKKVDLTDTELFSAMAGNIVGAATLCKEIGKERVSQATDGVSAVVVATSADQDEQKLSKLLFMHNIGGGRQAVQSGEVDCQTVGDSLEKLQQFAQRIANNANTGGSE
jgi:hypothetical protein